MWYCSTVGICSERYITALIVIGLGKLREIFSEAVSRFYVREHRVNNAQIVIMFKCKSKVVAQTVWVYYGVGTGHTDGIYYLVNDVVCTGVALLVMRVVNSRWSHVNVASMEFVWIK